jgi:hypothetical protein
MENSIWTMSRCIACPPSFNGSRWFQFSQEKRMLQRTIVLIALTMICLSGVRAGAAEELLLSEPLPVVNRALRIYLPQAEVGKARVEVRLEATREIVAQQDAAELGGKVGVEFTPAKTGYYIATARSAGAPARECTLRFPVVGRDLKFTVWPPLEPQESHLRNLSSHVIVIAADKNPQTVAFWRERGSRVLAATFTGGRQIDLANTDEANIEKLVQTWAKAAPEGSDGIYIDELGAYPTEDGLHKIRIMNQALQRYRAENPHKLMYAAVAGAILPELSAGLKAANASALLEIYEPWVVAAFGTHRYYDYIDQRIQVARHTDLIYERGRSNSAVIFLGAEGMHGGVTKPQLEDAVRYIRKQAPEMPGIAFYSSGKTQKWLQETGMRLFLDELCERYFVQPVVELNGLWPDHAELRAGRQTPVQVRVDNVGGMEARQVRVRLYATAMRTGRREQVGEVTLDRVGVGSSEVVDKSLEDKDYRIREMDGRPVPVFNIPSQIAHDRALTTFYWTPRSGGAYTLQAVIEPNPQFTVLEGVLQKSVSVLGGD